MTTTATTTAARRVDVLHPLVASVAGAVVFAVALTAGEALGLNSDTADSPATSLTDVLLYAGLVLAAVIVATWLGTKGRSGPPERLARYSLALAVGSAVTFVAFWSSWPQVFGAVAIASALEHRRRVGGFGAMTAIAAGLGTLALAVSTYVCVVG